MKRFLMFMMFAAIMMATSAQAAKGQMYFAGNFAFGILTDSEAAAVEISFDPGFGFIGAVGYDMGEIRVEGEIGYRLFDIDERTIPPSPPISTDGDFKALTFMVNGYYDIEMPNSPLTPYVGFGLGFVDNEIDVTGVGSASEEEFAYQVMLGLGYEISPNTVLTAGYRFFGFTNNEGAYTHELNLGARFMF